jgi:hypothetical protein
MFTRVISVRTSPISLSLSQVYHKFGFRPSTQGIGVYFQAPRNHQVLEEFLTAKSKKSKKEEKKGPKNKNFFDFFDFAVNLFFKVCCFSGIIDV